MAGRIIFILFVFLINFSAFVSESCVQDLPSLIAAFSSNETTTDNILRIQETFYPQNKPAPHYVTVYYCFEEPCDETTINYTYIWAENPIFFIVDYYLFSSLTFKLADLGGIAEQSFIVPVPCNNNTNKNLLLALTLQLKSIGGTDKNLYYARYFHEKSQSYDYDKAKIVITIWLIFAILGCLITVHILMCKKEARERLGKYLKRFALNYSIDDQMDTSLSHEKILFFFIVRVFFPVMLVSVCLVTGFDIYFYCKYGNTSSYNDQKFLYLFPIPCVVPFFFAINVIMSVVTAIKVFYWEKKCRESTNENTPLLNSHEQDRRNSSLQDMSSSEDNGNNTPENNNRTKKNEESNHCQNVLISFTLVLLFGIVYLFYHGFWMIVALLAFPGRVLIGGIFIIPLILVTIPIWNTIIKIVETCYNACTCTCKCYKKENESSQCKNNCSWKLCCELIKWSTLLFYELGFWGFFITILFYISRFLLGSIDLDNKTFQLVFYYITINAFSGILLWLNTDLVAYPKDRKENQGERQQENQGERQQENRDERQQENQDELQQ